MAEKCPCGIKFTSHYCWDRENAPRPCDNVVEWGKSFEIDNRRVAKDFFGGIRVSTVFLGIDHGFGQGQPVLFETMIFSDGGEFDDFMERYHTADDALIGHKAACDIVLESLKLGKDQPS